MLKMIINGYKQIRCCSYEEALTVIMVAKSFGCYLQTGHLLCNTPECISNALQNVFTNNSTVYLRLNMDNKHRLDLQYTPFKMSEVVEACNIQY